MDNLTRLSKYISLILRHKPEAAGIKLDRHGWANVQELIDGINASGRKININILEQIVAEDEKQRYSFNFDHTQIRANQGHSINVDVELEEATPPDFLYHGTGTKSLDSITKTGIKRQSRNYVHLSGDIQTAFKVGARHGRPVVLIIDTKRMSADGIKFYVSRNRVWLCGDIEPKYIASIEYGK